MDRTEPVQLSIEETAEILRQEDAVYLDVRSVAEFERGHPEGALNVPILFVDPETGAGTPNPDFVDVVAAHVGRDQRILCGCATGMRSQQAAMMLRRLGYEADNVACGFDGKRDPLGRPVAPGWKGSGLPTATGEGGERGWRALREGAEGEE